MSGRFNRSSGLFFTASFQLGVCTVLFSGTVSASKLLSSLTVAASLAGSAFLYPLATAFAWLRSRADVPVIADLLRNNAFRRGSLDV